ncbi:MULTISPECIES: sensor histidine kinase [Shewanella]|uniref:histidine kinase n=1 Tax=Shewanella psychromarinicola TaxID=2487742 RepID=A0A3N4EZ58_9GAMM|nr:PhnD/SsuA/transferrin family substrate-binding protein [Shewanella psychromarinicola]AZG36314.1 sensor histidine kinase [Shewanella psychromarinicola]MCL1080817.1 PhnD/SsuA/transferrin family substrate-binding protein [Shewanella psychromarinicola]RPA34154.1 sensor histidine kinase [Shewanella psychromarinicola]
MRFGLLLWFILVFLLVHSTATFALSAKIAPVAQQQAANEDPVQVHYRVAVLANYGVAKSIQRWQPLMTYLTKRVKNASFEVVPLDFNHMNDQLLNGQVQFVVTNPGHYFNMSSDFPISWLATMKSNQHNGSTFAIGATIIVRSESPYKTLEDLSGHSVVASDPSALGGYQAAIGLINSKAYSTNNFFGKVTFLGFPLEPLIYQVRDGTADIAITPFCTLEQMVRDGYINAADYRVINDVTPEGYECAVSTHLYPNWSFASSDAVPLKVRTDITRALLSVSATHQASIVGQNRGWAAPISQFQVVKLFKELDIESNKMPVYLQVWQWIKLNQKWGFGLLGLFVIATIYHLWLEYRFRQKSENLLSSERQLKNKALQLERLQSAAILGEIGAGLAHELNQPIAAITQYSEGGMIEQANNTGEDSKQYQLLDKIHQQSIRAGEIVHRIRGLLQRKNAEATEFYVHEQLMICLELLEHEFKIHNIKLNTQLTSTDIKLTGDKVGFCQVLINVLKNAVDAMSERGFSAKIPNRIRIDSYIVDHRLKLKIYDNGIGLSCSADDFKTSFFSTKENGLGLGLAICNDVIMQFGGKINLSKCKDDPDSAWQMGCRVLIDIPLNNSAN